MQSVDALARHALDTLPLNVAVIDEDGTILLTNRSWEEFAGVGPAGEDMVGVNYLDATDTEDDEFAQQALEGLRTVIAGEQELFTLEYPCHSPDQKRWFLMRATPLPPAAEGSVVVAHIDITARKLAELQTRRKQRELEHILGRLQGLVVDVMEAVLHAEDRAGIESTVVERLASVEDYTFAWLGRVDLRTETVTPAATAGSGSLPDGVGVPLDGDDPVALALRRREPQVVRDPSTHAPAGVHDALGADPGAVAAFPLVYGDTEYGVLTLYAPEAEAFDERELAVLQVLARVASTAINAVEGRRILAADDVVELEVTLRAPGVFFADLSADLECTLAYEGALYGEGEDVAMLFVASGADPEALLAAARAHEEITAARLVTTGEEECVLEVEVSVPPIVDAMAERGAETTALRAEDGQVRVTVELPAGADTRALIEALEAKYESVSLAARHERERREQTRSELVADIEAALTDRQRLALEKAHMGGFFDWPREVSGEDLAASMDISPSTYHQHLRAAERKVLDALFDG